MPRSTRPARLQQELDRIASERLEAERQANRVYRWALVRACFECIGSCALGLVVMAFAFHVSDPGLGKVFLYGGMVVGYSGITMALWGAYRRGEERGDW